MKLVTGLGVSLVALLSAQCASATEVIPYTVTSLAGSTTTQQGRLSRARPPSDWATQTPFPGIANPDVTYEYQTVTAAFTPNALQDVYYEITIDDPDAVIFASAYNRAYHPDALDRGYLGDEGSSGNYFPADPSYFDVIVPKGGTLKLVFNSVGFDDEPFAYQVSAFSDSMYDEDFKSFGVPEPTTWALMVAGFGLVGAAMRRRVAVSYA